GRHLEAFVGLITTFVLLLLASILVFSITLYAKRRLEFAWRVWITKNTLSVWMAQGRHYQLGLVAGEHGDNPDGRSAQDMRVTPAPAPPRPRGPRPPALFGDRHQPGAMGGIPVGRRLQSAADGGSQFPVWPGACPGIFGKHRLDRRRQDRKSVV